MDIRLTPGGAAGHSTTAKIGPNMEMIVLFGLQL